MNYEEFENYLLEGLPAGNDLPEYDEVENWAGLMDHTRRFLISHGVKDLTSQIDLAESSNVSVTTGGFADIYRARTYNNAQVAVRVRRFSRRDGSKLAKETASGADKWNKCQGHHNIHELLGFTMFRDTIGLVSYWASNGTVRDYINKTPNADRLNLCVQICEGVSYLHRIGIIHGDVKGANVVVMGDGTAKLIDFDEVLLEDNSRLCTVDGALGFSLRWAAPEVIEDATKKTRKTDIYALGMTILEIITNKVPWNQLNDAAVLHASVIKKKHPNRPGEIPEISGENLWNLLVECWQHEPNERPSATSILRALEALPPDSMGPLDTQSELDSVPQSGALNNIPKIRRSMSLQEITLLLTAHDCRDVSQLVDEMTFDEAPSFTGGRYGNVFRGKLLDSTEVCIKVPRYSGNSSETSENRVYNSREIHTWSKCNHPNILPFLGMAIFRDEIAAVSPYMKNGTLRPYLKQNPDVDRCRLGTQICEGVAYLHSIGVVHGDLKGDNVLISDDGSALLTDFGSADIANRGIEFTLFMNRCGHTMRWTAPELMKYGIFRCEEADVYALGMTILETLTGEVPFKHKRQDHIVMAAVMWKREMPARPDQIPIQSEHGDKLWGLLCECWSPELESRPKATEVVIVMGTITKEGLIPVEAN